VTGSLPSPAGPGACGPVEIMARSSESYTGIARWPECSGICIAAPGTRPHLVRGPDHRAAVYGHLLSRTGLYSRTGTNWLRRYSKTGTDWFHRYI
jgi:hypothetical protein